MRCFLHAIIAPLPVRWVRTYRAITGPLRTHDRLSVVNICAVAMIRSPPPPRSLRRQLELDYGQTRRLYKGNQGEERSCGKGSRRCSTRAHIPSTVHEVPLLTGHRAHPLSVPKRDLSAGCIPCDASTNPSDFVAVTPPERNICILSLAPYSATSPSLCLFISSTAHKMLVRTQAIYRCNAQTRRSDGRREMRPDLHVVKVRSSGHHER